MKYLKIITILSLTILLKFNAFSIIDTNNVVFLTPGDNWKYLHYFYFINNFDSIGVGYTLGEFRFKKDSVIHRIYLSNSDIYPSPVFQGDSSQGVDDVLSSISTTNFFNYQSGSTLLFFRQLELLVPCEITLPSSIGLTWQNICFLAGINRIQDYSEWVIHLVRASDNQIIYTIDSVGIAQNSNSEVAPCFGTEPLKMNIVRELPDEYSGVDVYLKVQVKRFGTTPFGMDFKFKISPYSLSSLYEYSEQNYDYFRSYTDSDITILNSIVFNREINFFDSLVVVNGNLSPDNSFLYQLFFPDSSRNRLFLNRYFDSSLDDQGRIIYFQKSLNRKINLQDNGIINPSLHNNVKFIGINPNPIINKKAEILINSGTENLSTDLELYSINGDRLTTLKSINLIKGLNKINISLNQEISGLYYLVLKERNKRILDKIKLIVE